MDRRDFLRVAALGAAGAAVTARGGVTLSAAPSVLTPGDLRYRGVFLLPNDTPGVRFAWSAGALACRQVGGQIRLFIAGSSLNGDQVFEVAYPGAAGPAVGSAPRAELVRAWGDIYKGKRLHDPASLAPTTRGLLWAEGMLWWAYGGQYNVAGIHDPSIGATVFNDANGTVASYGPWRTSEHSQKTRGYMAAVPSSFASQYTTGKIAVGSPPTSGNVTSPMGSWMSVLSAFNPVTTPPDRVGDSHVTIGCRNLLAHDLAHPQQRPAGARYRVCHGAATSSDPTFRNAVGEGWIAFDAITACAWVQTTTKEGLVMFGQIADVVPGMSYGSDTVPHMWYGPEKTPCAHGQMATVGTGTGPKCTSMVPYLWIYDAETLGRTAQGSANPASAVEAYASPLHGIAPAAAYPIKENFTFGGACFDPASGLLFLAEIQADQFTNSFEPRPVIHVFDVGGAQAPPAGPDAPPNVRVL